MHYIYPPSCSRYGFQSTSRSTNDGMTETQWLDIFGDNLKSLLAGAFMSQRELADAAGLAESTISSYINKRKLPSLKAIINIAHALDISIDELINFDEPII